MIIRCGDEIFVQRKALKIARAEKKRKTHTNKE